MVLNGFPPEKASACIPNERISSGKVNGYAPENIGWIKRVTSGDSMPVSHAGHWDSDIP